MFREYRRNSTKTFQSECFAIFTHIVFIFTQYDGEKDTRTPGDFVNHANAKHDDIVEADDEEAEEEDPEPVVARGTGPVNRASDLTMKVEPEAGMKRPADSSDTVPMTNVSAPSHCRTRNRLHFLD